MFGGGSSLVYTPSLAIIGHYFQRKIGVVNGIVAAGSSLFTAPMPHILTYILSKVGVRIQLLYSTLKNLKLTDDHKVTPVVSLSTKPKTCCLICAKSNLT